MKFEELSLSQEVLKAIAEMGFKETSPIQTQAIPFIMQGRDVTGMAMTGTGKTAAFGLPLIEKIDPRKRCVQALVVCPTRELAIQVSGEIHKFLKYKRSIEVMAIYGGQSIDTQFRILRKGVHIVVGTPGRLLDHIDRGTIRLDELSMIVLDEADEMMDMGFRPDIEKILQGTPDTRQTVTFSATMPPVILELVKKYQKNPQYVKVSGGNVAATTVEQHYYEVESTNKVSLLRTLIKQHNPYLAIIFCNTKYKVDDVASKLRASGYLVEALHSDISQPKRNKIMTRFRQGEIQFLVATDVAARGIDVPNIDMVVNFEIPKDEKSYVHRSGRTGRAGKTGLAINFVSSRDAFSFRNIRRTIQGAMTKQLLPALSEFADSSVQTVTESPEARPEQKENRLAFKIQKALTLPNLEEHIKAVESMVTDEHTPVKIAAALFSLLASKQQERAPRSFHGGGGRQRYRN